LASSGVPALDKLLADGYPDKSAILVIGPPGIGKEALGYWFTSTGLVQGDFSLYVTKRSAHDLLRDAKGFGVDYQGRIPFLMAREGGQARFNINDLAETSFSIKEILKGNENRRIRIAMDIVSPLLMLNQSETVYRFLSQLIEDTKQYDAVLLATMEESMHTPQVLSAMQELFDGVLEMKFFEEALSALPLLRIRKMTGTLPHQGFFMFAFSRSGMEISAYVK
jgi:KaiC/GvpD/RAD55 family RecA-like ATPase